MAKKLQSHWFSVALGKDGYECVRPTELPRVATNQSIDALRGVGFGGQYRLGRHYWAIKVGGDETYIGTSVSSSSAEFNML